MAYGMEQLRKAGHAIRNFDDAYSNKIGEMHLKMLMDKNNDQRFSVPVQAAGFIGSKLLGSQPSTRTLGATPTEGLTGVRGAVDKVGTAAFNYGIPAVSAASKYVAPVAGVTLAGRGIIDLTAAFGSAADEPEPMTLELQ